MKNKKIWIIFISIVVLTLSIYYLFLQKSHYENGLLYYNSSDYNNALLEFEQVKVGSEEYIFALNKISYIHFKRGTDYYDKFKIDNSTNNLNLGLDEFKKITILDTLYDESQSMINLINGRLIDGDESISFLSKVEDLPSIRRYYDDAWNIKRDKIKLLEEEQYRNRLSETAWEKNNSVELYKKDINEKVEKKENIQKKEKSKFNFSGSWKGYDSFGMMATLTLYSSGFSFSYKQAKSYITGTWKRSGDMLLLYNQYEQSCGTVEGYSETNYDKENVHVSISGIWSDKMER